jgi:hypothetical protein
MPSRKRQWGEEITLFEPQQSGLFFKNPIPQKALVRGLSRL